MPKPPLSRNTTLRHPNRRLRLAALFEQERQTQRDAHRRDSAEGGHDQQQHGRSTVHAEELTDPHGRAGRERNVRGRSAIQSQSRQQQQSRWCHPNEIAHPAGGNQHAANHRPHTETEHTAEGEQRQAARGFTSRRLDDAHGCLGMKGTDSQSPGGEQQRQREGIVNQPNQADADDGQRRPEGDHPARIEAIAPAAEDRLAEGRGQLPDRKQ